MVHRMDTPALPRLLMLEFVVREPWVFNSRYYPQVAGLARKHGAQATWLTFGTAFTIGEGGRHGVVSYIDLPPGDLEVLRGHLERLRPTHVMTSDGVSARVLEVLRQGRDDVRVVTWADSGMFSDQPVDHVRKLNLPALAEGEQRLAGVPLRTEDQRWACDVTWYYGRTDWLLDWLGLGPQADADRGAYLVGSARPCYDAHMANPQALAFRPRLTLMGGLACDYRAPIRRNALFDGVKLQSRVYDVGCSFCTNFKGPTSDLRDNPVTAAEEQLRAVLEDTRGGDRRTDVYDVHDVRLFLHLERFVDMVLRLGLPPSEFMFSPRVDRFLIGEHMLDRVLPRMAAAGHVLNVYRMGAENLNRHENRRLNKLVSREQIDRATQLWRRLLREHPTAFRYDGTYGYIAATPWTTLEDLEAGVAEAIRQGFAPQDVWLYAPLEIQPMSALADLARHDGCLVDGFDDPSMLYKPSINNVCIEGMLPWRFRDARAAAAFALMVRHVAWAQRAAYPDTVFHGDALYAWLGQELERAQGQAREVLQRSDWFAREVVECVRQASPPLDLRALAARALELLAGLTPEPRPMEPPPPPGPDPAHPALTRAASQLREKLAAHLPGVVTGQARWSGKPGGPVALAVEVDRKPYELLLFGAGTAERHLFRTPHFKVALAPGTPLEDARHLRLCRLLVEALDRALANSAPRLLQVLAAGPAATAPASSPPGSHTP
jgi:hypothetical protein